MHAQRERLDHAVERAVAPCVGGDGCIQFHRVRTGGQPSFGLCKGASTRRDGREQLLLLLFRRAVLRALLLLRGSRGTLALLEALLEPVVHVDVVVHTALDKVAVHHLRVVTEAPHALQGHALVPVAKVQHQPLQRALRAEHGGEGLVVALLYPVEVLVPGARLLLLVGGGHVAVRVPDVGDDHVPDALHLGRPLLVALLVKRFEHGVAQREGQRALHGDPHVVRYVLTARGAVDAHGHAHGSETVPRAVAFNLLCYERLSSLVHRSAADEVAIIFLRAHSAMQKALCHNAALYALLCPAERIQQSLGILWHTRAVVHGEARTEEGRFLLEVVLHPRCIHNRNAIGKVCVLHLFAAFCSWLCGYIEVC